MADIKIVKIDEDKSKDDGDNPHYVIVLSGNPDANWVNNLKNLADKNKANRLMNIRVNNNELSLNTPTSMAPQQMLELIQSLIKQVDENEDTFKNKLKELNQKLSTPVS